MKVEGNKELAFVHIDTNFLFYGSKGEGMNKQMKEYFSEQKWTNGSVYSKIA